MLVNLRSFNIQKEKESKAHFINKDISEVLVICTGGTLCMVKTPKGYMAQKGLIDRIKTMHSFHDTEYAKHLQLTANQLITPETPYHKRVAY